MDLDAAAPTRRARLWRTVRELVAETNEDNAVDAAASVAFWLLLSLPATVLAGLAAVSLLGDEVTAELREVTLEFIDRVFTSEADELRTAVDGVFDQNKAGLFSATIVLALVTASRGFAGLIRALDVVYDIEEPRHFVRLRLAAIGLAIGTIATIAGSTYLWWLTDDLGIPLPIRVGAALGILIVWAATIFHIGPAHHTPWRYDLPGAVVVAVGWFAASIGYGWYINVAGGGNQIVGLVGALLLGMTWIWVVCLVLLVGGELNEIIARRAGVVAEQAPLLGGRLPSVSASDLFDRWRPASDDD
ncbi:MAG: YihY/virulence factor BrkB family protein [Ilumatobacteraceae bacterium]